MPEDKRIHPYDRPVVHAPKSFKRIVASEPFCVEQDSVNCSSTLAWLAGWKTTATSWLLSYKASIPTLKHSNTDCRSWTRVLCETHSQATSMVMSKCSKEENHGHTFVDLVGTASVTTHKSRAFVLTCDDTAQRSVRPGESMLSTSMRHG